MDYKYYVNNEIKREILYGQFIYGTTYSIKIFDLLKSQAEKKSNTCVYLLFHTNFLESYKEIGIVKGDIVTVSFPLHTFQIQLDYVLRKDGKTRSMFLLDKRYDIFITFIRHSKYRFEILNYSFDPSYAKI